MGLFTGKALLIALTLAVPVTIGIANTGRPSEDIRLTANTTPMPPAAIAADCAGFPTEIALEFGRRYNGRQIFTIEGLPVTYDAKIVTVHQAGGCLIEPAPKAPPEKAKDTIVLAPAIGLRDWNDTQGEGLPVYVIAEMKARAGSMDRVFITLRLPPPARAHTPKEPARIA